MKKEILAAVLAVGFIFTGVISASAGTITWTLIETTGMKLHSPGADNLLGTSDDGLSDKCNFSDATACAVTGNPTTGAYSFTEINFVQASSCALANSGHLQGDECTQNSDCGAGVLAVCADCNTPGQVGLGYFAKNPSGGSKGLGKMTASACDNGFNYSNISIGTSEVVGADGGGCMTLTSGSGTANSGCSTGSVGANLSLDLYTSTIPGCGFKAGTMPGLALAGRIYDAGTNPPASGTCNYTAGELGAIMTGAGLGTGEYLNVMCGSGTLPSDLQAACLPGASWLSVLVSKTSTNVPASCADECSTGCMAGTAEGVE